MLHTVGLRGSHDWYEAINISFGADDSRTVEIDGNRSVSQSRYAARASETWYRLEQTEGLRPKANAMGGNTNEPLVIAKWLCSPPHYGNVGLGARKI